MLFKNDKSNDNTNNTPNNQPNTQNNDSNKQTNKKPIEVQNDPKSQKLEDQNKVLALSGQTNSDRGKNLKNNLKKRNPNGYKRLQTQSNTKGNFAKRKRKAPRQQPQMNLAMLKKQRAGNGGNG